MTKSDERTEMMIKDEAQTIKSEKQIKRLQKIEKLKVTLARDQGLLKKEERKQETRRKILVGTFYLEQARKSGKYDELLKRMDSYLTRDHDRAVFEFAPIPKNDAGK